MRTVLVACVLAGCYQPATESCYYQCAAGASPCPSGLACSGGMCVTPGETCNGTGIDGVLPDTFEPDAPPSACGDGMPTRGEICYDTPQTFSTTSPPFDGVLADRDGDGDLDLIYMVEGGNGGYRQHVRDASGFPASSLNAPSYPNVRFMRAVNLDAAGASEFIGIEETQITTLAWGPNNALAEVNRLPRSGGGLLRQALVGNVMAGPHPNLVLIGPNMVEVFSYDPTFRLVSSATTPLVGMSGTPVDVALGRLTGDPFGDLAFATSGGIATMHGNAAGQFINYQQTSVTSAVVAVEIGDVDGDTNLDIVFVTTDFINPTETAIGILHGMGNGSFAPAVTLVVPNLGDALEVRDIDGDNRADIFAVRTGAQRSLAISLGRGDRQIEPPQLIPLFGTSAQISVRDSFNDDTVPDIVVTDRAASRVYVYPSNP